MKRIALIAAATVSFASCGEQDQPLVGSMSERSICDTAGYLIRQNMSDAFKTLGVDCSVTRTGSAGVEIESGYIAPPNDALLRYTARGTVRENDLRLTEIMVHGADDGFIPFSQFGF